MAGVDLTIAFVVILFAFVVGEFIYRRSSGKTRLWGNFSQGVYALFAIIILAAAGLTGGIALLIAAIFIPLYFALLRTRGSDVLDAVGFRGFGR